MLTANNKNLSRHVMLLFAAISVLGLISVNVVSPRMALAITVQGTNDSEILKGTQSNDTIYGEYGNDTIYGYGGDDILYGGRDSDQIFGSYGDDQIFGWTGSNNISGGPGNDYILATGEPEEDDCCNGAFNQISGGSGNDFIRTVDAGGIIHGNSGNDTIEFAGEAYGTIYGDGNNDKISITSDVGATVYGGYGNDEIYSAFGGNLNGGPGNDILQADSESVTMSGGEGADTFVCTEDAEENIVDYNSAEGDVIENPDLC